MKLAIFVTVLMCLMAVEAAPGFFDFPAGFGFPDIGGLTKSLPALPVDPKSVPGAGGAASAIGSATGENASASGTSAVTNNGAVSAAQAVAGKIGQAVASASSSFIPK